MRCGMCFAYACLQITAERKPSGFGFHCQGLRAQGVGLRGLELRGWRYSSSSSKEVAAVIVLQPVLEGVVVDLKQADKGS